ncbi:MAG TPA: hypothetical protein VD907_01970 [Verrucomicrobiae bacterium]|nr:hypothetical protein [Verrucomicrobiae bacterium]
MNLKVLGPMWPQFIDGDVYKVYGNKLPADLAKMLKGYQYSASHDQAKPEGVFRADLKFFETAADNSVRLFNLPDHNPTHFKEVRDNFLALFDAYYGPRARSEYLVVRQVGAAAAYSHDFGHCGATLIRDAPANQRPRGYSLDQTLEWASASEFIKLLQKRSYALPAQVFSGALILGTTFGAKDAAERSFRFVPAITSQHRITLMIRVADSRPMGGIEEFITKGANVLIGEVPATSKRVTSFKELIEKQLGYIGYVKDIQSKLDKVTNGVVSRLGWAAQAKEIESELNKLHKGDNKKLEAWARGHLAERWKVKI